MDDRSPIETAIQNAIDGALLETHTMLPGVIQAFDPVEQLADIQITIQRKMSGELYNMPLLVGVPVRFQKTGGFAITCKVSPGDHVMLIFAERSIDNWLLKGGQVSPEDTRKHTTSDAFAIPWMYPQTEKIASFNNNALELRNDSGSVKMALSDTGIEFTGNLTVNGNITQTGDIGTSGNITTTAGDVTAGTVTLKTHLHLGVGLTGYQSTPIAGSTSPPTP